MLCTERYFTLSYYDKHEEGKIELGKEKKFIQIFFEHQPEKEKKEPVGFFFFLLSPCMHAVLFFSFSSVFVRL